jgi:hypothetical protein
MITYFYWFAVVLLIVATLYLLGNKFDQWKAALITSCIVGLVGVGAYYFHYQQIFVKRYGGIMTIKVPDGQLHIAATWKDDNLWIENYDPKTNTCHFSEYSRGNLLEGKVTIKRCNPIRYQEPVKAEVGAGEIPADLAR